MRRDWHLGYFAGQTCLLSSVKSTVVGQLAHLWFRLFRVHTSSGNTGD